MIDFSINNSLSLSFCRSSLLQIRANLIFRRDSWLQISLHRKTEDHFSPVNEILLLLEAFVWKRVLDRFLAREESFEAGSALLDN